MPRSAVELLGAEAPFVRCVLRLLCGWFVFFVFFTKRRKMKKAFFVRFVDACLKILVWSCCCFGSDVQKVCFLDVFDIRVRF